MVNRIEFLALEKEEISSPKGLEHGGNCVEPKTKITKNKRHSDHVGVLWWPVRGIDGREDGERRGGGGGG